MKTLEQLNELSDYEINCAVAEKLGYRIGSAKTGSDSAIFVHKKIEGGESVRPYDWCNRPDHYMPIAIEHCIQIKPKRKEHFGSPCVKAPCGVFIYADSNDDLPRAVCIAFLLMEIDK